MGLRRCAVAAFIALSIWHELTLRAMARAKAAVAFYRDGAARIEDRWMRAEPSGERFKNADHPYADDLDIFGPGSLFQLLSLCRTPMGEERLARLAVAARADRRRSRERQARVAALRPHLDLRERIAVVNAGQRRFMHARPADRLGRSSHHAPAASHHRRRAGAGVRRRVREFHVRRQRLAGASPSLAVNGAVLGCARQARATPSSKDCRRPPRPPALDLLSNVIKEIEREPFDEPALIALAAAAQGR